MPTLFPGGLDSFTSPIATNPLNAPLSHTHAHVDLNDSVEALEAKVGVDSSAVVTSLDFLVRQGMAFVGQTIEWNSATDPPVGVWADEDGRQLAQAVYPVLFALLGTTWNQFRGQNNPPAGFFRIPLSSGLVAVAAGGAGTSPVTSARALGDAGGEETHLITSAQTGGVALNLSIPVSNSDGFQTDILRTGASQDDGANFSVGANTDASQAHNTMQPFAVKRKIIRIL